MNGSGKDQTISPAIRTTLIYIVLAGLWITSSDRLLAQMSRDVLFITQLQTFKGWIFVIVTAALLYFLINRDFRAFQRSQNELKASYDDTLEGWVQALNLRDHETNDHTQRLADLTLSICKTMDIPQEEMEHLRRGVLLHDIGKMGVPDHILHKPGPLDEAEWAIMRQHPTLAHQWLSHIKHLQPALIIPYFHHERWDGSGYPHGLKADEIPLPARIFAIVDVWDALCSDRPYRPAWSSEKALQYIQENAGILFDPGVVQVFEKLIQNGNHP